MALTTALAFAFISGVLRADATLMALGAAQGGPALSDGIRVYRDGTVPAGAKYPMIILAATVPGMPVKVIGNATIWSDVQMTVKCVDSGSTLVNIVPITTRLDELLESAAGTVVGGEVFGCVSGNEIMYPETEKGVTLYTHAGRVWHQWCN